MKLSTIQKQVEIKNRRASFEFTFLEKFICGMVLGGTEIKSIRQGKANITDAYCVLQKGELYVRNLSITEYDKGTHYNHEPLRDRKLLVTSSELKRIEKQLKDQGITLIPLRLFISEKGWAKLEIAVAKGKKTFDKREDIKKRDTEREIARKLR